MPQALRDMEALEKNERERIVRKVEEAAATDPFRAFQRLRGCDEHRMRVGGNRAIALIAHSSKTIEIHRVGHRKHIYKRLFK